MFEVSMSGKEENDAVQPLETSTSNAREEPTGVNQLQYAQESQPLEPEMQQPAKDIKPVIMEEFGRLMEKERKSLVDGQRLRVELNHMKHCLETSYQNQLENLKQQLEISFQQQLNGAQRSSSFFQQQLATGQNDLRQQLSKLQGRLKRTRLIFLCVVIAVLAVSLPSVDLKSWSPFQRESAAKEDEVGSNKEIAVKHFFKGADELRRKFPSQTERLWRIMEAATLPIIEEENPTHPAVILLVAAKRSKSVAECLAWRYAELVTESLNAESHATFNCMSCADSHPDDAKRQLDSILSDAFDAGSKSGVVLHLEKLPGSAPMIFYRFADNDNAPYKDVAIVLTLTLEATDTGSERDNVAYDELRKVWGSSLDVDKVEPLLSRIGNSVAFVRPETEDALSENGCQKTM